MIGSRISKNVLAKNLPLAYMASITTKKHGSSYFSQIVTSFFNKCKYVVPSVFNGSVAVEGKFFAEIFSENFLFGFSSRTNKKLHSKSVIP